MRQKPKFPTVSVILMIAFSLIGTLLIILPHGEKLCLGSILPHLPSVMVSTQP